MASILGTGEIVRSVLTARAKLSRKRQRGPDLSVDVVSMQTDLQIRFRNAKNVTSVVLNSVGLCVAIAKVERQWFLNITQVFVLCARNWNNNKKTGNVLSFLVIQSEITTLVCLLLGDFSDSVTRLSNYGRQISTKKTYSQTV